MENMFNMNSQPIMQNYYVPQQNMVQSNYNPLRDSMTNQQPIPQYWNPYQAQVNINQNTGYDYYGGNTAVMSPVVTINNIVGYIPEYEEEQQRLNEIEQNWTYCYDAMPSQIANESRGINSGIKVVQRHYNNMNYNNPMFNAQLFQGYTNPILQQNQMQMERLRQREDAIQQGKIWRTLLGGEAKHNDDFDLDGIVQKVESMYYFEPPTVQQYTPKEQQVVNKNEQIAMMQARIDEMQNRYNHTPWHYDIYKYNFYSYYDQINKIIGDPETCDMTDYFSRVYPVLYQRDLLEQAKEFNKNGKNRFDANSFNTRLDSISQNMPDSYFYKLMNSMSDNGVQLRTDYGLTITPDEMEVTLPQSIIDKQRQKQAERRAKFYSTVFSKEA